MPVPEVKRRMFVFEPESQYRDLTGEASDAAQWRVVNSASLLPKAIPLTGLDRLLVPFIKDKFAQQGLVWSLPTELLDVARSVGALPLGDESDDVVRMSGAEQLLLTAAAYAVEADPGFEVSELSFFRVMAAYPERKSLVKAAHIEQKRTVEVLICQTMVLSDGQVECTAEGDHASLDAVVLASVERLRTLIAWQGSAGRCCLRLAPAAAQALHDRCALANRPLADDPDNSALALLSSEGPSTKIVGEVLECFTDKPAAQGQHSLATMDLVSMCSALAPRDLPVFEDSGILKSRMDEFGDAHWELVPGATSWVATATPQEPRTIFALPAQDCTSTTASKLDMALECARQGWTLVPGASPDLLLGGPRVCSSAMIAKSMLYFQCMLQAERVFGKGADRIMPAMPNNYYKCLLHMEDLTDFVGRADLERLTDRQFGALLKGDDLPIGALDLRPALEAAPSEDEGMPEGAPPLEDDQEPLALPAPFPQEALIGAHPSLLPAGQAGPRVMMRSQGGAVARFDNYSHTHGQQRGYVACRRVGHHACFKYTQVRFHASHRHCAAWLLAWELGAEQCASKTAHGAWSPPGALVEQVFGDLVE